MKNYFNLFYITGGDEFKFATEITVILRTAHNSDFVLLTESL